MGIGGFWRSSQQEVADQFDPLTVSAKLLVRAALIADGTGHVVVAASYVR